MSTFATIIVTSANQAAAQALTSSDMFTSEYKKTLSRYFVSSGYFKDEDYTALTSSSLIHEINTDESIQPFVFLSGLGLTRVDTE